MGLVRNEVAFKDKAPSLTCIVDKITELSGLSLSIKEGELDTNTNLYDLYAQLSFSSDPHNQLKLHAYRSGAVRECYTDYYKYYGDFDMPIEFLFQGLEGFDEPVNTQAIYLENYLGQEPTLFYIAIFALEALGGSVKHPLSEDIKHKYLKALTPFQLKQRSLQVLLLWLSGIMLLPIFIPLWLLQFVWLRGKFPKILRKAQNDCSNRGGTA